MEKILGILKVDSLINHQVDPKLMDLCGLEFAQRFAYTNPTRILTAEISGIAPALMTARHLNLPVVYARKNRPVTMPDTVYLTIAPSHTKGQQGGTDRLPGIPETRRESAHHR